MGLVKNYADAPIQPDGETDIPQTSQGPVKAYPQTQTYAQGPVVGVPIGFQPATVPMAQTVLPPPQTRQQLATRASLEIAPGPAAYIPDTAPLSAKTSLDAPRVSMSDPPGGYRQSTLHDGGATEYDDTNKTTTEKATEKATEIWGATSKGVSQMTEVAGDKVSAWSESAKQWFNKST